MSLMKKLDDLSAGYKVRRAWLAFAVALFICLIVVPAIFVVTKVFTEWDLVSGVLEDPEAMSVIEGAVWNSFSIAFIVTLIDIVVGLPMAWIMVRRDFKGKRWLDTLLDIPLAFPTAVLGISVVMFWGAPDGVTIPGLGLDLSPYMMLILLHIIFTYPYMVRSLSGILEQIDVNFETAAMTLGASKWTAVRTITIPLFRAGLATGFILCFARSLSETGGTYIALSMMGVESTFFTGPSYISWLKSGEAVSSADYMGAMILISVIMIVAALLLLVAVKWIIRRFKIPFKQVWPELGRMVSRGSLPKAKDFLTVAFLLVIVLLPSFYIFAYLAEPIPTVDYGMLLSSTGTSMLVAGVAVIVDIVLGVPLSLYIARHRNGKLANILDGLVNVPLIIPTTALGFSLALFWGSFGASDSMALILVILGHISFTYPLALRIDLLYGSDHVPDHEGDRHDPGREALPGVQEDPHAHRQVVRHRRRNPRFHQVPGGDRSHPGDQRQGQHRADIHHAAGQGRGVCRGRHLLHNPDRHLLHPDDGGQSAHPQEAGKRCLR